MRITTAIRDEIIRKSFDLFEKWHGEAYSELVQRDAMTANAAPKGITSSCVEVCASYEGMSHNQRYHVLEATNAHAYVRQEKALSGIEIKLSWNPGKRRYDRIYPPGYMSRRAG